LRALFFSRRFIFASTKFSPNPDRFVFERLPTRPDCKASCNSLASNVKYVFLSFFSSLNVSL
jgi:hypothetical protein